MKKCKVLGRGEHCLDCIQLDQCDFIDEYMGMDVDAQWYGNTPQDKGMDDGFIKIILD